MKIDIITEKSEYVQIKREQLEKKIDLLKSQHIVLETKSQELSELIQTTAKAEKKANAELDRTQRLKESQNALSNSLKPSFNLVDLQVLVKRLTNKLKTVEITEKMTSEQKIQMQKMRQVE